MTLPLCLEIFNLSSASLWVLIIPAIILAGFSLVFSSASRLLVSHKKILLVLLSVSIFEWLLPHLPDLTRRETIDYFASATYAARFEELFYLIGFLGRTLLWGLITLLILQAVRGEQISVGKIFADIKYWGLRGILAGFIGTLGFLILFLGYIFSNSAFAEIFWLVFAVGLWNTTTFVLYPLLIDDKRKLAVSIPNVFKIHLKTVHKWFYLFLLSFLVVDGFKFIRTPFNEAAILIAGSQNVFGWNAYLRWLGGYTFTSNWYGDIIQWFEVSQPLNFSAYYFFVTSVIVVLIKIKIIQILLDLGYISKVSRSSIDSRLVGH